MRRVFSIAVLAVALILFTQQSHATPIIYVESGQLSGTLGNTVLTNASFTFTFIGDTNNIFTVPGSGSQILPAFLNPAISNTIVIGGSTGTFTSALVAFVDPPGAFIGVIDWATGGFQISFFNAGTVGYNLATSIGPLTSSTFVRASGSATTSLGTLTL